MFEEPVSEILRALPARIAEPVQQWAQTSPDHPALVEANSSWTYQQLNSVLARTQAWLGESGVRPGDRVLIAGENCRGFISVLLAATELGAWPVLVNARLSAGELEAVRNHCGPRRVIYTTSSPHASEHAKSQESLIPGPAELGPVAMGPLNENVEPEPADSDPSARVAAVIYTSGTTGLPKGVMLTHRNLLFIAAVSARIRSLTPRDRLYGVLPMTHAVGLSVVLLGSFLSGATLYLAPRFDPMSARLALEKDQLTVVLGVPSMFAQFLQYAKLRRLTNLNLPALRIISSSGAPLDSPTKKATEAFFGMPLHNGYGITECSPTIAQTRVESPRSDTAVGPLLPGVEATFLDANHRPVDPGEIGELRVRGPNIMKGYYRDPQATSEAVDAEGWFNTRDLAKLEDGNLFIVGRTKDLIVRSGFNVYPIEVETVLNAHPSVVQSAVIGRSIEGDEEILAFVQPLPEMAVTPADLSEFIARRLAPYKRPSRILIMSDLPMTATGKIAKAELRKAAEDGKFAKK